MIENDLSIYPLNFYNDGSCKFYGCSTPYFDNYFCNNNVYPELCNNSAIQSQNNQSDPYNAGSPNTSLIQETLEPITCDYSGCIDVHSDENYFCTKYPSLCAGTINVGTPPYQGLSAYEGDGFNYTNDNSITGISVAAAM